MLTVDVFCFVVGEGLSVGNTNVWHDPENRERDKETYVFDMDCMYNHLLNFTCSNFLGVVIDAHAWRREHGQ